jgi:hypothetical protein
MDFAGAPMFVPARGVESSAEQRLDIEIQIGRGRSFEDDVAGCDHSFNDASRIFMTVFSRPEN